MLQPLYQAIFGFKVFGLGFVTAMAFIFGTGKLTALWDKVFIVSTLEDVDLPFVSLPQVVCALLESSTSSILILQDQKCPMTRFPPILRNSVH